MTSVVPQLSAKMKKWEEEREAHIQGEELFWERVRARIERSRLRHLTSTAEPSSNSSAAVQAADAGHDAATGHQAELHT
jgi:hypothetical protein